MRSEPAPGSYSPNLWTCESSATASSAVAGPAGALLAALGLAIALAGCGSSDPKPPKHPTLCGQPVVETQASFGDLDLDAFNPAPGLIVPIENVAHIHAGSASGCTVTLAYSMTAATPISALSVSARIGSTTAVGRPVLQGQNPGVTKWSGKITLPLPARATTATVIVAVPRYQETGKTPVTPSAARRSVTVYLSPITADRTSAASSS